jgi:hypothetical protein
MILFLALILAAAGSEIRLASPGLSTVGVSVEAGRFYSDHLAHALTEAGVHVVTATEITTLLGAERQRQLLGCSDSTSSCMAELSGALGVDGLVTGSIARIAGRYQLNVSVLSAAGSGALASYSGEAAGDEGLIDELDRAAHDLAPAVAKALGRPLSGVAGVSGERSRRAWALAPGIGAVVFGVAAGALLGVAKSRHDALSGGAPIGLATAEAYRASGPALQLTGDVALGLAGACLAAAVLVFILGGGP